MNLCNLKIHSVLGGFRILGGFGYGLTKTPAKYKIVEIFENWMDWTVLLESVALNLEKYLKIALFKFKNCCTQIFNIYMYPITQCKVRWIRISVK